MFLGRGLWVFPEILTRSKCFYSEAKFPGKTKKFSIPVLNMKKSEVCSCAEREQKPEYYLARAVNPLKPEVIHRNYGANSTDPVVKLNFSFYSFLRNCSRYCPFLSKYFALE